MDRSEELSELMARGHSYRNFEPAEIRGLADTTDKAQGRMFFDWFESGRFAPMLDATHAMYCALDPDERFTFRSRNPDLMEWCSVWAYCEDLNDFRDE